MARSALFVSCSTYADTELAQLPSAARDALELGELFGEPAIGPFSVSALESPSAQDLRVALEDLFADAASGDVVVLYLSGHGLKDMHGNLYFAARDTRPSRLQSTAVSAQLLCSLLNASRAEGVVVFLDCCYGGAFARGMVARAAGDPQVGDAFAALGSGARSRAVITASSAIEYAFEGERLTDSHVEPSVFASAMRDGIAGGDADRDGDGWVGLSELFDYIRQRIQRAGQPQTPHLWTFGASGDLLVARSPRGPRASVSVLPAEIRELLASPVPAARLGAATDLRERAGAPDLPMARASITALVGLTEDDSLRVRAEAKAALAACAPSVEPGELRARPGETVRATMSGPPVALEAFVESPPAGVVASVDRTEVVVRVGDEFAPGTVALRLRWAGGVVPVPLVVEVPEPAVPEQRAPDAEPVEPAKPAPPEPEPADHEPANREPANREPTDREPTAADATLAKETVPPAQRRADQPIWLLAAAALWLACPFLPIDSSGFGISGGGVTTRGTVYDTAIENLPVWVTVILLAAGVTTAVAAVSRWRRAAAKLASLIVAGSLALLLIVLGIALVVWMLAEEGDLDIGGFVALLAMALAGAYLVDAGIREIRTRRVGPDGIEPPTLAV